MVLYYVSLLSARLVAMHRPVFSRFWFVWRICCSFYLCSFKIKADRPLMRDKLNVPWLLTNRQFQWTGNGHSQLPLAVLGKPRLNIDLLHTTGSNRRAIFHCLTLTFDLQSQASQGQGQPSCQKSRSNGSNRRAPIDKRTDPHTHMDATKCIISPAMRSLKITWLSSYSGDWDSSIANTWMTH